MQIKKEHGEYGGKLQYSRTMFSHVTVSFSERRILKGNIKRDMRGKNKLKKGSWKVLQCFRFILSYANCRYVIDYTNTSSLKWLNC